MKSLIILLLFSLTLSTCNEKFVSIPEYWFEDLYPEFIPAYKIDYWEYRNYTPIDSTTEILFKADSCPPQVVIPNYEIASSYRNACHHVACYDYIVSVKGREIDVINDIDSLLLFIGDIDNLEEGLFIRHIIAPKYYSINEEGEEVGMYNFTQKEVNFILLKDESLYPKIIGQYLLSINRTTHEITSSRIKTYYEEELE